MKYIICVRKVFVIYLLFIDMCEYIKRRILFIDIKVFLKGLLNQNDLSTLIKTGIIEIFFTVHLIIRGLQELYKLGKNYKYLKLKFLVQAHFQIIITHFESYIYIRYSIRKRSKRTLEIDKEQHDFAMNEILKFNAQQVN